LEFGCSNKTGNLLSWSSQGVLLLNSILTVEDGKRLSHKNIGWEIFTDKIIKILSDEFENNVFISWENYTKTKEFLIDKKRSLMLKSAHHSSYNIKGFLGNKHFKLANSYLINKNEEPINW